ncbi:TonB-dependent receptor [Caulobacter soli]|uniref:TonB-dependent receptor n=1 Tax=Caulobacter soli TaxID=2708539 RepID=UPI0013EC2059|nr:TonB-dependent receptor [Caulobacter soli]
MFNHHHVSHRHGLLIGAAALALVAATPAPAQEATRDYDLPAQALGKSLGEVARVSGRQVVVSSSLVRDKTAPALKGRYTAEQAYDALLARQNLKVTPVGAVLVLQAAAPGEPQPAAAESLSEIVVTGTRIRGAAPVGSNLIAITRRDIEASGYATTQQIVQALPQNYGGGPNDATAGMSIRNGAGNNIAKGSSVNLRGLGPSSTLVLIDGVRPALGGVSGTFADLSLVPSSVIERVEVLADGASALYGSDAVAGVVNLAPRRAFDGAETSLRYGAADGFNESQASQLFGRRWSSGHAVIAYEVYRRDRLAAADRDYASENLSGLGGLDYRSTYAGPGTIVAGGRNFAIPAGQNGRNLAAVQLAADQANRGDAWAQADLLPRQTRHSAYAAIRQDLNARVTVFGDLLWAQRKFDSRVIPDLQAVTVSPGNPFYVDPLGTGQPISLRYNFTGDLGPTTSSGTVRAYNGVVGAVARLNGWSGTVTAGFGEQTESTRTDNMINRNRLGVAVSDPNPASAYNLFGDAGSTNRATIAAVRGFTSSRGLYDVWFVGAKLDGALLDLPAGTVKLAVGAEHRQERFKQTSLNDVYYAAPQAVANVYPPSREISAAYGELLIPVIGERGSLVRRIDLSLAGRVERYDGFGSTSNPKIGLDWRPIEGVTLRGSYGTSFRAPGFQEQILGPGYVAYQPITIPDPQSPTGVSTVLGLLGNTADIGPERAKTWTAGLEVRPTALPGLHAGASYYNIRYRDRIADPNSAAFDVLFNRGVYASLIEDAPALAKVAGYYATPFLYNPDNIPASAVQIILDLRVQNLSVVRQDGVDFDLGYDTLLGGGQLSLGLTGSYIFHLKQGFTPTAPRVDVLGTVGNPPPLRARGAIGWSRGDWALNGFVNFVDGYRNQTITPAQHVEAWTTTDLQLSYRSPVSTGPRAGLRASLSISNLFDRDPPFAVLRTPSSVIGYDADNASPAGRLIAFQVTKAW